uniref:Uncharacterized protein n=1 Tax=Candidatus Kentrum sp. MB TaxID=2138164 RepID=A0A450XGW3_9GAMM|nr:MAG: hypothetical protein BECKMB1821G_GA0114241_103821 [Candidatus Kentron sp. MB]
MIPSRLDRIYPESHLKHEKLNNLTAKLLDSNYESGHKRGKSNPGIDFVINPIRNNKNSTRGKASMSSFITRFR